MLSIPPEVFIRRKDKKEMKSDNVDKNDLDMQAILQKNYERGIKEHLQLELDPEAEALYDEYHDSAVEYRENNKYEESRVSVMSKSVGLSMRISGVISLLRIAINNVNLISPEMDFKVTKEDYLMALTITKYSVESSFALLSNIPGGSNQPSASTKGGTVSNCSGGIQHALPVPEYENFTMQFAIANQRVVRKFLATDSVPLASVSRDKMYPIVQKKTGKDIAQKFVTGLTKLGLGVISPASKAFKMYHPGEENCPDRDHLRKKYKLLNMEI